MSFLFDKLFQKQNPELASQMAKRGLVFDKRKHRWVRGVQPDANVTGGEFSEIPGMEGPFKYKTGNTYYYSPKEGKYYDRGQDVFMPRGFDPHTGQYHQDIEEERREKEMSTPTEIPKWRRGDKVQVPHRGKMTTGTIVRYDGGEYYKGEKVGSAFYVVDVGEYESIKVPKNNVRG